MRWQHGSVTFSALDALTDRWAQQLRERGVTAGSRVGIISWNNLDVIALFFAAGRLGAALVPFNARLTEKELEPLITAAAPALLLRADDLHRWTFETPRTPAISTGSPDIVAALFTSGTTGTPRLVELTHDNFRAATEAHAAAAGSGPTDRWLLCLPLFHIGGLVMAYRAVSAQAQLLVERGFDAARVAELLRAGDVTHLSVVPTALKRLVEAGPFPPALRLVLVGGGPVQPQLLARARAVGLPVVQTYGLTEACSQVCTERLADADGETAGPPLPGLEVRVQRETEAPCEPDEVGFIEVKGPTVAPASGPWLKTGDLGSLDARGRLTIVSRRVDLIVSGGENIYPVELERIIAAAPGVLDVVVTPRPDAEWGQVPVAVYCGPATPDAVEAWCRAHLSGFKRPRAFIQREALPYNANGKVDRNAL